MAQNPSPKTPAPIAETQTDAWERWGWFWSLIFYATLFIPTALAAFDDELTQQQKLLLAGLASLMALAHTIFVWYIGRRPDFREHPWPMLLYNGLIFTGWYMTVSLYPGFYFLLFSMYSQIFISLKLRWAIPVSLVLSGLIAVRQLGLENLSWREPVVWFYSLLALIGVGFSLWLNAIIEQSAERRQLIEQLKQAQAELARAERETGIMQERQRLGYEIHDTLAQGFIGIIMHLEAAQSVPAEQAQKHLQQAEQMARENLQQARYLVEDLHPKRLQEASLPDAIMTTVQQWREHSKVTAQVTITGEERPLPPNTELALLRATQEALANVHKHAQAKVVTITLSYMADLVMLDVQDDGVGVNGTASAWQGGGFGLTAMRERVEQLGGSLLVESEDGEGTTVVVSIPVIGHP